MTCPQLIFFSRQPCSHQISQSLVSRIGNPYRREISSPVAASKFFRIPPICLSLGRLISPDISVGATTSHFHAQFCKLPIQHISCWTRFVTYLKLLNRSELFYQLSHDSVRLGIVPIRSYLSASFQAPLPLRYCFRVDIQSNKSYFLHDRLLSYVALHHVCFRIVV